MTREEHLKWCNKCTSRTLNLQKGTICSLTNEIADFEGDCKDFNLDETVPNKPPMEIPEDGVSAAEGVAHLSEESLEILRSDQQLVPAILAGSGAAVVGAIVWAMVTVATGYQIGYMAIAVGAAVGLAVRVVGKGIDPIFGYVGGGLALFGCVLGNLFSIIGFVAGADEMGYFETLSALDFSLMVELLGLNFDVIDLLFYGIAAYEGYTFAFRKLTEEDVAA